MIVVYGAFLRNAVADAYFPLYKEIMPMAFCQNRHKLFLLPITYHKDSYKLLSSTEIVTHSNQHSPNILSLSSLQTNKKIGDPVLSLRFLYPE